MLKESTLIKKILYKRQNKIASKFNKDNNKINNNKTNNTTFNKHNEIIIIK